MTEPTAEQIDALARKMFEGTGGAVWQDWMPDEWCDHCTDMRHGSPITWEEFVSFADRVESEHDGSVLTIDLMRAWARAAWKALKGNELHGRDLFEETALKARETYEPEPDEEPYEYETPELTELVIRLRVNTGTYASAEHIAKEIGESLDWLAYDHDAIYDGIWRAEETTDDE